MTDTTSLSERDEIELLLPWYTTGRLDAADRARVEAWLARDAALARQLADLDDDRHATNRLNEAVSLPATLSVHAAMQKIVGTSSPSAEHATGGLLSRISGFFAAPAANQVRWAMAAAGAIILVQAALLTAAYTTRTPGGYETASGGMSASADGAFAIVRFEDGASIKDIAAALSGLDMTITEGPRAGGLFRVRLGPKSMAADTRDARLQALRALKGLVALATQQSER
jgi:anti-sigma-K factor RskA